MICGNYYKAVLIMLLVLFGGFLGAGTAVASTFGMVWTGTHFASTTPTSVPFCVADYPYNPNWGVYGTGYVSPTSTYDFQNWVITASSFGGNYQVVDCNNPADPLEFATFYAFGGNIIVTDLTATRFTSFTYSTTTQYARIIGYWNASTNPNISETLYFYQDSTIFGKQDQEFITATTTGNFDFSFFFHGLPVATSTQNKVFGLYATINEIDNTNIRTTGECATAPFTVTWAYCGQKTTFLVGTSTIVNSFNYNLPPSQPLQQEYSFDECTLLHFDLGLCLADVAVGLFQPLDGDIHWESIKSLIETKAPFGYFTMAKDSLGNLSATSTPTAVITIPSSIKNTIFIPLDTAIAGILWFFFLFNFYKRLKFITV